jgi:hypothetical protein
MAAGWRRFIPHVLEPAGPIPFGAFDRTPEELRRRKRQHNHRSEVAFAADLVKQDVTPSSEAGVAHDILFLPTSGLAVDAGLDGPPCRADGAAGKRACERPGRSTMCPVKTSDMYLTAMPASLSLRAKTGGSLVSIHKEGQGARWSYPALMDGFGLGLA